MSFGIPLVTATVTRRRVILPLYLQLEQQRRLGLKEGMSVSIVVTNYGSIRENKQLVSMKIPQMGSGVVILHIRSKAM